MHSRCHLASALWTGTEVRLPAEESHHLVVVMRAEPGDSVGLFDGQGRMADGELLEVVRAGRRGAVTAVVRVIREFREDRPSPVLVLLQALPKGQGMDGIVEKATELGVSCIVPVVTNRVVQRCSPEQSLERVERWNRVALSAAKQCGTPWLPAIGPVQSLDAALAGVDADVFFMGSLGPAARSLQVLLDGWTGPHPRKVALLIGPEGDLDDGEREAAVRAGATEASFGRLVLRVETAAIYGLSVLSSKFLTTA